MQVFSSTGQFVARWGVRGRYVLQEMVVTVYISTVTVSRSPGQLQRPTGVCVLRDGRVAVADYDNKWVAVKISTLNMSEYCEARGTLLKIGTV